LIKSAFKILGELFKENETKCLLIGGYAVNSYKVSRHTADIDFMITEDSFNKIKEKLFNLGYKVKHQQDVFVQLTNSGGLRDLDFMFSDPLTLDKLVEQCNKTSIAGETFLIPSLENLIALKLHSIKYNPHRELNDLPDIINLIKANNFDYKSQNFSLLCHKFGSKAIYDKIIGYLN
jgi:hypothetical protein